MWYEMLEEEEEEERAWMEVFNRYLPPSFIAMTHLCGPGVGSVGTFGWLRPAMV